MKVIANLIRHFNNKKPSDDEEEDVVAVDDPTIIKIKTVFLNDLIKLFESSKENRRVLLQQSVWQDWWVLFLSEYVLYRLIKKSCHASFITRGFIVGFDIVNAIISNVQICLHICTRAFNTTKSLSRQFIAGYWTWVTWGRIQKSRTRSSSWSTSCWKCCCSTQSRLNGEGGEFGSTLWP